MQMDVSLIIECDFDSEDFDFDTGNDEQDRRCFQNLVKDIILTQRLAGGTVQSVKEILFSHLHDSFDEQQKFTRKQLFKLLPGFVLIDRSDQLQEHYQSLKSTKPEAEMLDAWLDFCAIKHRVHPPKDEATQTEESKAIWEYIPKPAGGWLVPISTGFQAISPLYAGGQVARTRDSETPFRFVESLYGIGEWLSLHRIRSLESIIWRYEVRGDMYLCRNRYTTQ